MVHAKGWEPVNKKAETNATSPPETENDGDSGKFLSLRIVCVHVCMCVGEY